MERAMQRARQKVHPGTPHSLSELAQSISDWNDRYGKLNGKPFFLGKFGTENEECLVAVVSDIVDNQFNLNSDWHLDGTFKCRPKDPKFCQLYVIMASAYGRSFPIVWALMKTRTVAAYNVLFSAVKTHIPGVMPTHIMSDYEKALWTAVKQNFPEARHLGCWFHFAQAIERNAKKMGITCRGDGWIVAKRLMATALLPYHRIEEAVNLIEGFAHSCNEPAPAMKLLQYFQREWMGKVTPKSFSVFEQNSRTNNAQEALNRCINRTIRPQGNTWEFWNGLMQISSKEAHSFSLLREGKECARKKKLKWILQDSNLKCLDEKLRRGDITLAEFISTASYRVASDIVDADEDEDMEDDPELISLNESEEEEASENELTGSLNELTNDEKFQSYRTNKIVLNVNSIHDCPSAGFVMEQLAELQADLTEAEEACEDSDSTLCWNCDQYKATRIIIPCGHWAGCINCTTALVSTPRHFVSIFTNGEQEEEEQIPLPCRCPHCQCIVGKFFRVY
ncbi:uncharacterized protein LOC120355520 isoform X2 [Nilaparvata lugens]|nr:uncharacterized protein LOC120355520 isoform X2 [Nilaparvata lugens]XP_039299917.1 uncharacterized protein LOC120355520 isoform X2 [Nilaparvata lugens]